MPTINTVQDIEPRIQYTGTAGQDVYVYPFPIFDERDIVVQIDDVDLILNAEYTVTGVTENNGGTVVLTVATLGGEEIVLYRDTPIDRLTDYVENGDFLADTVNNDFDRIILMLQELSANSLNIHVDDGKCVTRAICFEGQVTFSDKAPISTTTPTLAEHILRLQDVNLSEATLKSTFKKLSVTAIPGQTILTLGEEFTSAIVIRNGETQQETSGAYNLGPLPTQITLSEPIVLGDTLEVWINSLFLFADEATVVYPFLSDAVADITLLSNTSFKTIDYAELGDGGGANYQVDTVSSTDGFVDVLAANGLKIINTSKNLTASMAGMKSDGVDYADNLQALANKLDPSKTLYIDTTDYSLSDFVLFNSGYRKVWHPSGSKLTWLGAGENSTTFKSIFSVNRDSTGNRTNETLAGLTTVDMTFEQSTVTVSDIGLIVPGSIIRIEKHICRVESITGLVLQTDRTLPIESIAIGAEVATLDVPNIGSEFSGPSLLQFAPDVLTQNYGYGIVLANCFSTKVNNFYGLHNSSKVCEIFYCADSEAANIQQYEPADIDAGQGYALRISNGNDNIAREITSNFGRHCVDITFSHRNKVFDCKAYNHVSSPFLTHFNGCVYNDFIRCESHQCSQGVSISYDGDDFNRFIDGVFIESQGAYRPTATTQYINCTFKTTLVNSIMVLLNPRTNGESILNWKGGSIETVNQICNVDVDYTVNLSNGDFKLLDNFGLFRGIDAGIPGAPTSNANVLFNFTNVTITAPVPLGRNNLNAKVNLDRCTIDYDVEMFGHDMGDQKYNGCKITAVNGLGSLITVGSGNNNELIKCTTRNVPEPFRYFTGFPATGTVTFGDNSQLGTSDYGIMNSMNWQTTGYVVMPLNRTIGGFPIDGATVHIDSDLITDPFKLKRVLGSWVEWII